MNTSEIELPKRNIAGRIIFYFISAIVTVILVIVLTSTLMTWSKKNVPILLGHSLFSITTEGGYAQKGDMVACKVKNGNDTSGKNIVYIDGYDEFSNAIIKTGLVSESTLTNGEAFFKVANEPSDSEPHSSNDIIGEVSFVVPMLGAVINFIKTPLGLICCVAFPLFLLLIFEVINLIRLSKSQKEEENELESNLPSYMRISEIEKMNDGRTVELPDAAALSPPKKPVIINEAAATEDIVNGFSNKFAFEQQNEKLEFVQPKGAFQNITYRKPEAPKNDAHAGLIYSTREWQLPTEEEIKVASGTQTAPIPEKATPEVATAEKTEFSATIGVDTKNHFNIEGIDIRVVSDAIKLSLDKDSESRDISITVTNEYTNVVVETKTAEINFALFKDEADKEQKVIIQKKMKS